MATGNSIVKFSIRQMMLGMFFLALLSVLASAAYSGDPLAFGLVVAVLGLIVPAFCFALFSGVAFYLARCSSVWSSRSSKPRPQPSVLRNGSENASTEISTNPPAPLTDGSRSDK